MSAIRLACVIPALLIGLPLPTLRAQEAGRSLAEKVCAQCHAIGPGGASKGDAPAFAAFAAMPSATRLSLRVFLRSPHASMPAVILGDGEIDLLADYILSLAGK